MTWSRSAAVEDLADLRAITEAAERARRDEALLTERGRGPPGRTGAAGTGSPPSQATLGETPRATVRRQGRRLIAGPERCGG